MNRVLPELLHCLNGRGNATDMTVLERQRARAKWQQQEQQSDFGGSEFGGLFLEPSQAVQVGNFQGLVGGVDSVLGEVAALLVKPDLSLESGLPEFGRFELSNMGFGSDALINGSTTGFHINSPTSMTSGCPPTVAAVAPEEKGKVSVPAEKMSSVAGRESFKKRKADKVQNTKVGAEEDTKDKKSKGSAEEGESKITTEQTSTKNNSSATNNRETSADTSKENSKASEVQKPDYIHVRARRGQATDSHSLAERVRREKISERMKYLQDLVPGCNKITGKAGMLDEIINYVQSLQRQVEFLSMKLAAVNPRLDFNIEDFFAKELFPACSAGFPTTGMSSEMTNPAYLQFNPVQQLVSCCGLEMGMNTPDMAFRRTMSAPVSLPETYLDTSYITQLQPSSTWDADLQNLLNLEFHQGRSTSYASQQLTGSIEASNLKMEI